MASTLTGALGGAATGAELGTMIMPGLGTVLGALGGAVVGGVMGGKKQAAVDEAMAGIQAIPAVDPTQTFFKDQLMREKRSIESGFSTDFQVARDVIGQVEAGGMSVASELAMTNPALALMFMNQVSSQTDVSLNKALGTISTQKMGYSQMIGDIIEQQANRKLQLDLLKTQYKTAQATAEQKDFNSNMMALATKYGPSALDVIFGGGEKNLPGTGTTHYE